MKSRRLKCWTSNQRLCASPLLTKMLVEIPTRIQPVVALPCNHGHRSQGYIESKDSQDSNEANSDGEARLILPKISRLDSQNGHCDLDDRLQHG